VARNTGWRARVNLAVRALRGHPAPAVEVNADAGEGAKLAQSPAPVVTISRPKSYSMATAPALQGGRQSQPTNVNPFGLGSYAFVWKREYQDLDLSNVDIAQYEAGALLGILADLNPDVSLALWNILRVSGTGLSFKVTTPTGADDRVGQALVDGLQARINLTGGGFSNLVIQLLMTAYLQGAVVLDIAPTEDLDDVEDFFAVNPVTIFFQRDTNQQPVPYQRQQLAWGTGITPFRRMNTQLFSYTPIDPYVDDVYGRSPAAPVLQIVFFQAQLLRDLERVIHAQGWPKIDMSLVMEAVERIVPPDVRADPQAAAEFVQARMSEMVAAYNGMNPEDAYIHPDYVEINSTSATAGQHMFDVSKLLTTIRMQIIAALKQMPALMGEHLGDTETYSTVELTIFAATIDVFRQPVGNALAWAMRVALELLGHQAAVQPVWDEVELVDRLDRAKAESQEMANAVYKRNQGWWTQDQASIAITGSKAVGPAPTVAVPDPGPPGEDTKPSTP